MGVFSRMASLLTMLETAKSADAARVETIHNGKTPHCTLPREVDRHKWAARLEPNQDKCDAKQAEAQPLTAPSPIAEEDDAAQRAKEHGRCRDCCHQRCRTGG